MSKVRTGGVLVAAFVAVATATNVITPSADEPRAFTAEATATQRPSTPIATVVAPEPTVAVAVETPRATQPEPTQIVTTSEATPEPPPPPPPLPPRETPPPQPPPPPSNCHPSYQGECIPLGVSDADCWGGGGNGPYYVRTTIRVVGPDVFGLDRDGDGLACDLN